MNKQKAKKILEVYGKPKIKLKNKTLVFARQNRLDVLEIEKMKSAELIKNWKSLVWTNHIYGQVDLNELQRIDLIELEMKSRNIDEEELSEWFDNEMNKIKKEEKL